MEKKDRIEQAIQKGIVDYLELRHYLYFAPTNGVHIASYMTRGIVKRMGRVAGVPDLIVFVQGKVIGLEVKRPAIKGICVKGVVSPEQKEFGKRMTELGHEYHVVYSVKEVEDILRASPR